MKKNPIKIILCSALISFAFACGHNNNQSEGAADSHDDVSAPSAAAQQNGTDGASNSATDTVVKGNASKPGEGNYTSGTGAVPGNNETSTGGGK